MRDLDETNPPWARPDNACRIGALIPVILGAASVALAMGASTATPITANVLALLLCCVVLLNCLLFFIPRMCRWDWNIRYFLVSACQLASIALLGSVPWLCFLLYGAPSWPVRALAFLLYLAIVFLPCLRLVRMYAGVRHSATLMRYLYQRDEEDDVHYYVQKNDVMLLEKKYKVSMFPSARSFIGFGLAAFGMIPFAAPLSALAGLPFPHLFMGVIAIPIDMMGINFLVKAWLVFAYLPCFVDKRKGRKILVDMASRNRLPATR